MPDGSYRPAVHAVRGPDPTVTALLRGHQRGEPEAFDHLVGLLYNHLRRLAYAERARRGARGWLRRQLGAAPAAPSP